MRFSLSAGHDLQNCGPAKSFHHCSVSLFLHAAYYCVVSVVQTLYTKTCVVCVRVLQKNGPSTHLLNLPDSFTDAVRQMDI